MQTKANKNRNRFLQKCWSIPTIIAILLTLSPSNANVDRPSSADRLATAVNDVLKAPDNPPPLSFNPNSIKDIAAIEPNAGIDLIQPPNSNGQGSAELSYPIRIPAGRGAFSPQPTLTYSSERGNGWLGIGWDLALPRIEIDTRWGVPAYDGTERFLLNGSALAPISKDSNAACVAKASSSIVEQYAARSESFERILRCRAGNEVYWEVTDKSGTRFEYGTDGESQLKSYYQGEENHVAIWYLRQVVDANDNITEYRYQTDDSKTADNDNKGEPFVQVYLHEIKYTLHPDQPAAYKISFIRDCDKPTDVIVSGRTGFKVVTRCRLEKISISLLDSSSIIREYNLEYTIGAFGKSLLSKIQVAGTDGSDYYAHTFEYTQPEFQETDGDQIFAETDEIPSGPENEFLSNTSETSHEITTSLGFSFRFGFGESFGCDIGFTLGGAYEYPTPEVLHIDLNGDSKADRVWKSDDQIMALLGESIGPISDPLQTIHVSSLDSLGTEDAIGASIGESASCDIARSLKVGIGASFSYRRSDTNSLLADADGDGIADLTFGGTYYRGLPRTCRNGEDPIDGMCPSDGLRVCPANTLCFDTQTSGFAMLDGSSSPPSSVEDYALWMFIDPTAIDAQNSGNGQPHTITPWGPNTALRQRMEQDPILAASMYPIDPVIRWDAPIDGTVNVNALVQRLYLGGEDGVTVSLLHVTDPSSATGTTLLGTTSIGANSLQQTLIAGSGSVEVKFGESLLLVLDTNDDVPVSDTGLLLDELNVNFHIEYTEICRPQQPCRELNAQELSHRDPTGQLAYVFDYPEDFRISELPREEYWQLIPPIGPARLREDGTVDSNHISGSIQKALETSSPVHVRIRCETMRSQRANDGSECPLGTVLWEHVFECSVSEPVRHKRG